MKVLPGGLNLSATDLANHLSCRHLTALNLRLARGEIAEPSWDNPHARVLQQRGLEHEKAYIQSLRSRSLTVVDLSGEPPETARQATIEALKEGAQVIVQGTLASDDWHGRADVLLRVEDQSGNPTELGNWSYEVADCKLARETKAETILQLCLYSQLLAELQGSEPKHFHVIRPNRAFEPESYRFSSFAAYFRVVQRALREAVNGNSSDTYPEPVSHCEVCRWWKECDHKRRGDDHISFVAGASRLQRKELTAHDITTLEALAALPLPIPFNPTRGGRDSYNRIREQARIQFEARAEGKLKFELLESEQGRGLYRLPSPSPGDIFLDYEGDPFVGEGGLEYLFGIVTVSDTGSLKYERRWVLDRAQERVAFEWFIDFTFKRLSSFPDLHIYHFGAYEPGAVKRLMLRYATREEKVDHLLRGERFIDLHSIIRQSMRASVEQYSLKNMEKFTSYQRMVPLSDANSARHFLENQLELGIAPNLTDPASKIIEGYNEDDCRATWQLREWLEKIRAEVIAGGTEITRPARRDTSRSEGMTDRQRRVVALFDALTRDVPMEPKDRTPEQAARWLLAHALDWHRREEKVLWWEFFRMKDLPEEDIFDERAALAGLSHQQRMPKMSPNERSPVDRYHYPSQECSIRVRDTLFTFDQKRFGEVVDVNSVAQTLTVKKPNKLDGFHPTSVFAHSHYGTDEQSNSILRIADWIVSNGIDSLGDYRAARDLLLRNPPRLLEGHSLAPGPNESIVQAACRVGLALDRSVIPIQGPPGAGKTFAGARMICELVNQGKKVGVTAVSHKVIRKLLDEVLGAAREMGIAVACAHRKKGADSASGPVREIGANDEALQALEHGEVNVLGGTSWLWAREEFTDSVHVLFVDEAGQMSLANVLSGSPAGMSLVLLGDPQQLEQPQKGSHPEGSDISALAHLLDGKKTISEAQGLFLAETWRLHPSICAFTSEMFYEGRLHSLGGLEHQRVLTSLTFSGAGLWFVPVAHEANRSYSMEEVDCVSAIVESLTRHGASWINRHSDQQPLTLDDILIVAPYNDQVNRIVDRLPSAKVGTVDKFQGQEAAIVIYSMATSSSEDAPRGMEFLYNLNRFNVASSRAQCACIVVGNPRLFSPDCRTPRQMELANVVGRYGEMSTRIAIGVSIGAVVID